MTPDEELEERELRRAAARERTRREVAEIFGLDPAEVWGDYRVQMLNSAADIVIWREAAERRRRA